MRIEQDFDLTAMTTFGVKVKCKRLVEATTTEELQEAIDMIATDDDPLLVIGGGSNLLFSRNFPGSVIHPRITGVRQVDADTSGNLHVEVGSGEQWDNFVSLCVEKGWHGAENLSLIPGEVGASAVQNIGAYGVEVSDIIEKVRALDTCNGLIADIPMSQCGYSYRHSKFKDEWKGRFIVTHVTFKLSNIFSPKLDYGNIRAELAKKGITRPTPLQLRETIIDIRRHKLPDPKVEGNAGSFFINPVVSRAKYESLAEHYPDMPHYKIDYLNEKIPAGWLIERCGWKGKKVGHAGVHNRQALVLVNYGGASGAEILHLSDLIRKDVNEKFGIELTPEVNII